MNTLLHGAKIFLALSAIVFVFALIYSGFVISDRNDQCQQQGGVLVKANIGYVCIDGGALK